MNVNFDAVADVESIEFKKFLLGANAGDQFEFSIDLPPGYHRDDLREGNLRNKEELFTYQVKENWKMYENCHQGNSGQLVGIHTPIILEQRNIIFFTNFVLYLKTDLSQTEADHARDLLTKFPVETGATSEEEVIKWISENMGPDLEVGDFILSAEIIAEASDNPFPFDTSQRETLLDIYEGRIETRIPVIHENDEGGLEEWSGNRSLCWKPGRRSIIENDGEPAETSTVHHMPEGSDPITYNPTRIIDDIVDTYQEPDCAGMKTYKEKLLIIGKWPEFKIKWVVKTIKIGCCKVKTKLPVAYTREGMLVFYGYYRVPQNLGRAILKIAESCLIKTALKSAIIGILTSNIAAAVRLFVPLYKDCLIEEAKECIYPGLLLLKESKPWRKL